MKKLLVLLVVMLSMAWAVAGCGGSTVSENSKKGLPPPGYEGMEKRMLMEKQTIMKQRGAAPKGPAAPAPEVKK